MDDETTPITTGTDERPPRALDDHLVVVDLDAELRRLDSEGPGNDPDRTTIALAKSGPFRVVLGTYRAGAMFGGDATDGALSLLVVRGRIGVLRGSRQESLTEDQVAVIPPGGPWRAHADIDSAVLLTLAWPEDSADISETFRG